MIPPFYKTKYRSKYLVILSLFWSSLANAANESTQSLTLDGILYKSGTTMALLDSSVVLKIQVINPDATCLLYEEQQTVDTSSSKGYFNVNLGSPLGAPKRTVNDPGRTMAQIFQNSSPIVSNSVPGQTCAGGLYSPSAGDVRYYRIIVTPSSTNIADTLTPDIVADSVPQAIVAQSLQGLEKSSILQANTVGSVALSQANLEAAFTTPAYANLQAILNGNFMRTDTSGATLPSYASTPSGLSTGDIWYDSVSNQIKYQSNSGVQIIGTSSGGIASLTTSANISINGAVAGTVSSGSASIDLADAGTPGTYTKVTVDSKGRVSSGTTLSESDIPTLSTAGKVSGNAITSGTISGSTAINTSGNIVTTGTLSGLTVQATNVRIFNGANYAQLTAAAMSGNISFALPATTGSVGQVLSTDGNGILSWISAGLPSLLDGKMWIGNGSNAATAVTLSGDATISNLGILTLNTVSVAKGGTGTTSMAANRIVSSNGTGSAYQAFSCSLNQVISFDASGNATCSNVSALGGMIMNGGNTTAGTISIGTNDNHALQFKANNSVAMTISQSGNVGIGTTSPGAALGINGDIMFTLAANRIISVTEGAVNGKSLTIQPGNGTSGNGGALNLQAGNGGGSDGGNVTISGGTGAVNNGNVILSPTTGNVGIGTTAPGTILDVNGAISQRGMAAPAVSVATEGRIYFDSTANKFKVSEHNGSYVDLVSSGGSISGLTAGKIPKAGSATSLVDSLIYDTGTYVGIGTTTPGAKLQVNSSTMATILAMNTGSSVLSKASFRAQTDSAAGPSIEIGAIGTGGTTFAGVGAVHDGFIYSNGTSYPGQHLNIIHTSGAAGNIQFFVNGLVNTDSPRVVFAGDGNVGIGTITPSSALDISGAFTARGMSTAPAVSSTNQGRIYFDYASNKFKVSQNGAAYTDLVGGASSGFANGGNSFAGSATLGTNDNYSLGFEVNNTTAMTISQNGNVGIGTVAPTSALEVTGNIFLSNGASRTLQVADTSGAAANALTVKAGSVISGAFTGGTLTLAGGDTVGSATPGDLIIKSGLGSGLGNKSGNITIQIPGSNGAPGTLSLAGGSSGGNGGTINITGGGGGTGLGGSINLTGGAGGGGSGADIYLNGGSGISDGNIILANSRGNVGIGISTPADRLSVNGNPAGQWATSIKSGTTASDAWGLLLRGGTNSSDAALRVTNAGTTADFMYIRGDGNVGIGTTSPGEKLEVNGNVKAVELILSSDRNLKKNIRPLEGSLENILRLVGVQYQWRCEEYPEKNFDRKEHMGLIAQDVAKIYPDLVHGKEGNLAVDYPGLIAPMIEALKEQNYIVQDLQQKISDLEKANAKQQFLLEQLMKRVGNLENK